MTEPKQKIISRYFSKLGKKGNGKAKRRGDSDYYRELSKKSAEARKAKKE